MLLLRICLYDVVNHHLSRVFVFAHIFLSPKLPFVLKKLVHCSYVKGLMYTGVGARGGPGEHMAGGVVAIFLRRRRRDQNLARARKIRQARDSGDQVDAASSRFALLLAHCLGAAVRCGGEMHLQPHAPKPLMSNVGVVPLSRSLSSAFKPSLGCALPLINQP